MVERHLSFYSGMEQEPAWQQAFYRFLFGTREEVEEEAVNVFRDVLRHFNERPARAETWSLLNLRVRLAIVYAEMNDWEQAEAELSVLEESLEGAAMATAVRSAYGYNELDPETLRNSNMGVGFLPVGWAAERLRMALAQRTGDWRQYHRLEYRQLERGALQRTRTLQFTAIVCSLIFAGVAVTFHWWRRGKMPAPAQPGALARPWATADGVGVFARAGVLGLACFAVFAFLRPTLFGTPLSLWGTLFASLPMVWLIQRHLLAPNGLNLFSAFGFNPMRVGVGRVLGLTLVLLTVDIVGSLAINWVMWKLGYQPHWSEGINERWIWGPWSTALLSSVDAVVWAPIFEEIGFRGLLYITLRTRLSPVTAAVISSALFSGTHLNSLAGFLAFLWSGLVWCYALERFRTLLPAMLGHAAGNSLAVATMVMFYR